MVIVRVDARVPALLGECYGGRPRRMVNVKVVDARVPDLLRHGYNCRPDRTCGRRSPCDTHHLDV